MSERKASQSPAPDPAQSPAAGKQAQETDRQLETAVGPAQPEGEQGGPKGPEPTRFGDWEKDGRCFDF